MRKRQQQIVKYVNENALAGVGELAGIFGVSVMTMRRDIEYLASVSLIKKVKGGAQILEKTDIVEEAELFTRINRNIEQKRNICREAYSLIRPGQAVFMDGSTTILPLAKLIVENNPKITIVTNSVLACIDLAKADNVKVINIGGELDDTTMCFVGLSIPGWVDSFSFDIAFFSSAAFSPLEGTFESSITLMNLKRTIAAKSNKVVYLADSTKFGNRALVKVLDISILDTVITDSNISPKYIKILKDHDINILVGSNNNKEAGQQFTGKK